MRIVMGTRWGVLLFLFYISLANGMEERVSRFDALAPNAASAAYEDFVRRIYPQSSVTNFVEKRLQDSRFGMIDAMKTSRCDWLRVKRNVAEHQTRRKRLGGALRAMWLVEGFSTDDRTVICELGHLLDIREDTRVKLSNNSSRIYGIDCVRCPFTTDVAYEVDFGLPFQQLSQSAKRGCIKFALKAVRRDVPLWYSLTKETFCRKGRRDIVDLLSAYNDCMKMEIACWITLDGRDRGDLVQFLLSVPGSQQIRNMVDKVARLMRVERMLRKVRPVKEIADNKPTAAKKRKKQAQET